MSGDVDYGRLPAEDDDHFHRLDAHLVATNTLMTTLDDIQATIDAKAMMVAYGSAGYGKTMSVNSALRKIAPDNTYRLELRSGPTPRDIRHGLFHALGLPGEPPTRPIEFDTLLNTLMILGRHQQTTARPSLIVTGPAAAGKTTALLNVGRACHLAHTRKNPPPPGSAHGAAPVAYVLVPPGATAKTLITEFARYLGIPTTTRMTQTQITDAVCHTYTQAGVQLVLIDEIHRLNPRTTTGAQAADLLKDLTERLSATFVYAGINVTDTPLFSGTRGAQLAGRATLITCGPLPARHGTRHPFRDVITDIENALDLHHHKPGTLPRHAPYLHQRTAGPHRIPHKAYPPSSHHRHPRRHRTHHQSCPRRGTTRPPRRNPPPPHPQPLTPHPPGKTALTSTNTKRVITR